MDRPTSTAGFKRMPEDEVRVAWRLVAEGRNIDSEEIGQARLEGFTVATGRARCRACGEKIAKGLRCIDLLVSFTDGSYNGWTAVEGKLHLRADCPRGRE